MDSGRGSVGPWLRRPWAAARMVVDALRLPVLSARPAGTVEGRAVRTGLTRTRPTHTLIDSVVSVLPLPSTLEEYVDTPARRPVRRKVRVALRVPVTWRLVTDEQERRALVVLADARERVHPDEVYRHDVPHNEDLFGIDLWIAAYGPNEQPLMLVVVPIDGEWAVLRYFRTLVEGNDASVARYLLTEVLVGELIARGVRWLADTESPFVLPNGLRHFQKMVGYELFRLRLS
ncbi:hypothetical protein [uncultured Amnibacterium sp.]|uniref:hypothetical protein n=1 Tax=uncultured Amnibacterium sp. TaxID=1631851 RepID=UPI0035CAC016